MELLFVPHDHLDRERNQIRGTVLWLSKGIISSRQFIAAEESFSISKTRPAGRTTLHMMWFRSTLLILLYFVLATSSSALPRASRRASDVAASEATRRLSHEYNSLPNTTPRRAQNLPQLSRRVSKSDYLRILPPRSFNYPRLVIFYRKWLPQATQR